MFLSEFYKPDCTGNIGNQHPIVLYNFRCDPGTALVRCLVTTLPLPLVSGTSLSNSRRPLQSALVSSPVTFLPVLSGTPNRLKYPIVKPDRLLVIKADNLIVLYSRGSGLLTKLLRCHILYQIPNRSGILAPFGWEIH